MQLLLLVAITLVYASTAWGASNCRSFGGLITLAQDPKNSSKAVVYDESCEWTQLAVSGDHELTTGQLGIQAIDSLPEDLRLLNVQNNKLTKFPDMDEASSIEELRLAGNQIESFSDLAVPPNLQILDLSWNSLSRFDDIKLPDSLLQLFLGGNGFTSLKGMTLPDKLRLLYIHDMELGTLKDANFVDSITSISIQNTNMKELEVQYYPPNLKNLDASKNMIDSLPENLPNDLQGLMLYSNNFNNLTDYNFPNSIVLMNLSYNNIESIHGVSFPLTLKELTMVDVPLKEFEVSQTDYQTIGDMDVFNVRTNASYSPCSDANGGQVNQGGVTLCVISDSAFEAKYGISTSQSMGDSEDEDSGLSTTLIVVICLFVVLLCVLLFIGYRYYRHKKHQKDDRAFNTQGMDNEAFEAAFNNPRDSKVSQTHHPMFPPTQERGPSLFNNTKRSSGARHSSGSSFQSHASHDFSMLYSKASDFAQVTTQLSDGLDSALVKYRIPMQEIQLERVIAKGGFGRIHLAVYSQQHVVVKTILPEKANDDRCLAAFLDEIKLCTQFSHPKVVTFLGVSWSTLADMSVVFEYMPHGDLDQLLKKQLSREMSHPDEFDWFRNSSMLPSKTEMALDVVEAIVYLHSFSSPIIHRDLKAKNVLLGPNYEAKLSDFGVSREWQVDATMTAGIGTMAWIAPEVLRGERYTESADIYSFGILLTELATCRRPFEGITNALIVLKVTSKETPSIGENTPEDIKDLAKRCMSFRPNARPSGMVLHYELKTLLRMHQSKGAELQGDFTDSDGPSGEYLDQGVSSKRAPSTSDGKMYDI